MRKDIIKIVLSLVFCYLAVSCVRDNMETPLREDVNTSHTYEKDSLTVSPIEPVTAKKRFRAGRRDTLACGGAVLYVESGSLADDKDITITPLAKDQLPHIPVSMVNVTGGYAGFRFLPHGNHFMAQKAVLGIPYDTLKIPQGYTVKDIATYYYDDRLKRWQQLDATGIDTKKSIAYASTTHFTDVINGILKVPESPETSSFTPTIIKDIVQVNPMSEVSIMEAPLPSATGDANMSYKFNIPPGRAGMTPDISLRYNSSGGSNYVGYGFSIPVEKIEIDTRWGCPLFSPEYESECYMLNGMQFTAKAHNHFVIDSATIRRSNGNERFYLRTDTEKLEIVRSGTGTKDYVWKVTDKNGIEKTFTGFDGYVDSVNIDTKPTENNIIEWVLTKAKDKNGNTVDYRYVNYFGTLYPSSVRYTGYDGDEGSEDGEYEVKFIYPKKRELLLDSNELRKDVTSDRRLGVCRTERNMLNSVYVSVRGRVIRSYSLKYERGEFEKTLLKSVTEYDSEGNVFHTHSFDYYNSIADGNLFSKGEQWDSDGSGYSNGSLFELVREGFDDGLSMINGSYSKGFSVGGGAHVAVGFGNFLSVYSGASYSYNKSDSEGRTVLADINADGLPDMVFVKRDTLCYRPNLGMEGESRFGDVLKIKGVSSYSKGTSEAHNLLVDAGAQFFFISGNACYSHNWQKSSNTVYLHDFNADGLVDIGYDGTVMFSHINEDGEIEFSASSVGTPCPILGLSVPIDKAFIPDVKAEQAEMSSRFPRHDVVRVWRAPYRGTVKIEPSEIVVSRESVDGVKASIQVRGESPLWSERIQSDGSARTPSRSVTVKEGDRIYFRLQSGTDAVGDNVSWSPKVSYSQIMSGVTESENGTLERYSAADDFLFCGVPDVPLQKTGGVQVHAPFSKGDLTDDIVLVVTKSVVRISGGDTVIVSTDIERRHLNAHDIHKDEPMDIYLTVTDVDVQHGAFLTFTVESPSQIRWEHIKWRPTVTYNGESEPFMYVAPKYTMYNRHIVAANGVKAPSRSVASVVPKLSYTLLNEDDSDGLKVNFSLKDSEGNVYYSGPYRDDVNIRAYMAQRTTLYGSFHVNRELSEASATISINGNVHDASVYCAYSDDSMGHMYGGWGQFAYNGEGESADMPIDESVLHIDTKAYEDAVSTMDGNTKPDTFDPSSVSEESLASVPSVNDQRFFIMSFVPKDDRYESIAKDSHVSATGEGSSRIGNQSINVPQPSYPELSGSGNPSDKTACPYLTMSGEGDSFTGSAGAIASVADGYGKTKSYTNNFINDVNGDGYPDWISRDGGKVMTVFTASDGRLTERSSVFDFTPSCSDSESKNMTAGLSLSCTTPDLVASIGKKGSLSDMGVQKASNENVNSSMSLGIDGNFGSNSIKSNGEFVDINGDGLPDYVTGGTVRYNMGGAGFTEESRFLDVDVDLDVFKESGRTKGAGVGVNVSICGKATAGGGVGASKTNTETTAQWRDMNGDGLPDYIMTLLNKSYVFFNVGGSILPGRFFQTAHSAGESESVSRSVSANVSVPIPVVWVTLTPSVTGGESSSVSKTTSAIMDIDGDGYPDMVQSDSHNRMTVYRSLIGNTNLLSRVTLPTGAEIRLDYEVARHSYGMPLAKRVLSKVDVTGGGGKDTITYGGGCYNRCERKFCGFDTVSVGSLDKKGNVYRTLKTTYLSRSFYTKFLPSERTVYDSEGNKLSSIEYTYILKGDSSYRGTGIFPALTKEVNTLYGEEENLVRTKEYQYDDNFNMTRYSLDGDLTANITYHNSKVVRNAPERITIGELAERSSEIDERGNMTKLTVSSDDGQAVYDMEYDKYGNLVKITRPENDKGERAWTKIKYDDIHHCLPVEVSDSYGSREYTTYNTLFAKKETVTDSHGDIMVYLYDAQGRLSEVVTKNDFLRGSAYTLRFEYNLRADTIHSVTYHNTPDGEFAVRTYVDSICRPLCMVRPSAIYDGSGVKLKNVTSGLCEYDEHGRTVKTYRPTTSPARKETASSTEYDALDRILSVTLPNGAKTTYRYSVISDDVIGKTVLSTTITDPNGNKTTRLSDDRGRTTATIKHHNGEPIRTITEYDAIDRPVKIVHPDGSESTYKYSKQGNLTEYTSPDAGKVTMTYTPQGQIKSRSQATGEKTEYGYDYERLVTVAYPSAPNDSVIYTYADSTAEASQMCRLIAVKDQSGTESYTYGDMGNVIKTIRTIDIDTLHNIRHTYIYGAEYDSWGRVREMIYPDGEKVTYGYHPTGELKSITGENGANKDVYLKETGYTVYGETAYRQLGNGTENIYMFDENERLLTSTLNMNGNSVSVNTYTYDKADNITDIYQSSGRYMQHYEYDDMNRLIKANGIDNSTIGDTPYSHYSMSMSYNVMSSPLKVEKNINSEFSNLIYQYGTEDHPNAPKQVGDTKYIYSASGNPLTITGAGVDRSLTWDAENHLRMIEDNESGTLHLYTYNHLGERTLKRFGTAQTMAINGRTVATLLDTNENYSAYVSPYFVENNNRYTKHYYAGTMRLASKIGGAVYKGVEGEQAGGGNSEQEPSENVAELNPGDTYMAGTDEPDLYFYFTDHLGSTTYITDREEVAQYVAYTPYGETFKECRNVTPYKFNGKELDQETGYYYYGARYYDPSTALWFGVDPLASKYPMNSPYIYCNGNPVRFIDIYGCGPAERVKAARDMTGIAYKQETTKELRTAKTDDAMEYMDCSEFVCRVMEADNITPEVEHLTSGGIYNKLSTSDDFESSLTNPQVGDIAVWEGHVGIVTETNGEKFRMAHARGVGKLSAENGSFISKEQYRSSQFLGFFRPVDTLIDGGELNTIIVQGKSGTPKISIPAIKIDFSRSNKSMNFNIKIQNE